MRISNQDEVRALLRSALDALKRGDKNAARSLAEQAASLAPGSEEPLLFLGALTSPEVSLAYINQALRINPESQVAQQALEWALKRQRNQSAAPEDDLFEIGPLLSARLAILAESVLEPDPPPKPIHPSTSPSISAETLQEPEPTSEPIQLPTSPAIPAETLPEPAPLSKPIQPPASPAVPIPASAMPEPKAESVHRAAGPPVPGVSSSPAPRVPIRRTPQPLPYPKTATPATNQAVAGSATSAAATSQKNASPSPASLALISALAFAVLVCFGLLAFWFGRPLLAGLSQATQPIRPAPASPIAESTLPPAMDGMTLAPTPATLVPNGEIMGTPGETIPTPSGDVQAEISLLETSATSDGDIQISVSILNYGPQAFTLRAQDVALTLPGGAPLEPDRSTPRLPEKVDPGETKTFTFTFPRPAAPTATLRIFTVEYDIEGY